MTTLRVGGPARFFADAGDEASLRDAFEWARARRIPVRILGGGSNVVIGDQGFDGLVLRALLRGVSFEPQGGDVLLRARAGEPWDAVVEASVARGLQGLECLSGIPGWVGATPIQNVGAYGQEVAECLSSVLVLDSETLSLQRMTATECRFGYRDSWFKSVEPERFVVLEASFLLRPGAPPAVRYAELEKELRARGLESPSVADVRSVVLALRARKSMVLDDEDPNARSCGSFFVNPVVTVEHAEKVAVLAADSAMPRFAQPDGRVKLAAGWLIERAGFPKGFRAGAVGLSTRHALAIVCHDGAQAGDVVGLAERIRRGVEERFGVTLTPEPVLWA